MNAAARLTQRLRKTIQPWTYSEYHHPGGGDLLTALMAIFAYWSTFNMSREKWKRCSFDTVWFLHGLLWQRSSAKFMWIIIVNKTICSQMSLSGHTANKSSILKAVVSRQDHGAKLWSIAYSPRVVMKSLRVHIDWPNPLIHYFYHTSGM